MDRHPTRADRRARPAGALLRGALLAALIGQVGCVSRSKFERCHQTARALQSEVAQLRDSEVRLRAENQDLNDRAVADLRRGRDLEVLVARQERILQAYQEDREQLAAEHERLIRAARGGGPSTSSLRDRLATFVAGHPGTTFDPERLVCEIPLSRLLAPASARLTPAGSDWLDDLARQLRSLEPGALSVELSLTGPGSANGEDVRPVSFEGDPSEAPLAPIRERLAKATAWPEGAIRPGAPGRVEDGPARLVVRLGPGPDPATALDDRVAPQK